MTEAAICEMATQHYRGAHKPLTGFSSWAASLHLVLCYAHNLSSKLPLHAEWVYVAVMDREQLEDEVLVWHVPHLVEINGHHEYLAYGRISGKGYKAVSLRALHERGLKEIHPELFSNLSQDTFGHTRRAEGFDWKMEGFPLLQEELRYIKKVAALYEELWLPVAVALICIVPRPWAPSRKNLGAPKWKTPPSCRNLDDIMLGLGQPDLERERKWLEEPWLAKEGMITTTSFPDVEQWIQLLRALLKHSGVQQRKAQIQQQPAALPIRTEDSRLRRALPKGEKMTGPKDRHWWLHECLAKGKGRYS
jgi:hypothetical protein